jgi:hypothetical protein
MGTWSSNLISDFLDVVIVSHFGVILNDVIETLNNLYKHGNLIKTRNKA